LLECRFVGGVETTQYDSVTNTAGSIDVAVDISEAVSYTELYARNTNVQPHPWRRAVSAG